MTKVADVLRFLEELSRDEPVPVERSRAYVMRSKASHCAAPGCKRLTLHERCREHRTRRTA